MIKLAGEATLQSSHVPLCTLLLFGWLPRLTRTIFSLKIERELAEVDIWSSRAVLPFLKNSCTAMYTRIFKKYQAHLYKTQILTSFAECVAERAKL